MFFSMPGIRQITFSLFCIWILGKLTELSGLFRTSHIVFGPEDAYSLNAGHRERIREAIRQGRFHPVTKGKQKDDDSTDHSRFNKDDATDHFQALPRLGSRVRPHKNSLDLLLPKPVIVVGFPKAGTSSIFAFFRQQQGILKCQHWVRYNLKIRVCLDSHKVLIFSFLSLDSIVVPINRMRKLVAQHKWQVACYKI